MKYIKTFRILAVALTLVLLAIAIPATPVSAAGEYIELTPTHGKIDDRIDIYGNYFANTLRLSIYFSAKAAAVSDRIDTDVLDYEQVVPSVYTNAVGELNAYFVVPPKLTDGDNPDTKVKAGRYYIYVTGYALKSIIAFDFITVESTGSIVLDKDEGPVGTEVKITGQGFDSREDINVEYDGDSVGIKSGDDGTDTAGKFTCTITIPESIAGDHTITVIGDVSEIEAEAIFTTEPAITITPVSGTAGSTVTVSGTGFGDRVNLSVFFDNVVVVADEVTSREGSFEATFTVPSKAPASYDVSAEDEDGNTDTVTFTYASAISLSPTSGYANSTVTVSGSGFKANNALTITFDNESMPSISTNATGGFTTTITVPVRTSGTYEVKVSDGSNIATANFDIGTGATISPTTGNVGAPVTINGVGFVAGSTVTVTYDGKQVTTTTVNTNGTFLATFNAPASLKGAHTIIATDGTNTQQFTFVMESTPPATPMPLKPEMGIKAKSQAYFDWEEVTDPSGVTYTLQIATDEDFSTGSIVLEKTGITTSEYTLTKAERLKSASEEAPYYWRIRAVDDASNASEWTGAGKFTVGFSFGLSQGVIYTLIGIGALILLIFGFWLGRKTSYY